MFLLHRQVEVACCVYPGLDDNSNNVVDMDLDNYIEYTKGLDLLSNTSIYGVEKLVV